MRIVNLFKESGYEKDFEFDGFGLAGIRVVGSLGAGFHGDWRRGIKAGGKRAPRGEA
jgi:hypothetical protein